MSSPSDALARLPRAPPPTGPPPPNAAPARLGVARHRRARRLRIAYPAGAPIATPACDNRTSRTQPLESGPSVSSLQHVALGLVQTESLRRGLDGVVEPTGKLEHLRKTDPCIGSVDEEI